MARPAAQGWLQAKGTGLEIPEAFGQRGGPVGCRAVERLAEAVRRHGE